MAASDEAICASYNQRTTNCGPCESRKEQSKPDYWCTVCEEGLCLNCCTHHNAMKLLRNHKTISFEKFKELQGMLGPNNVFCHLHGRQFDLYCPSHEASCCSKCTEMSHSSCKGIKSLQSFAAEYRESTSLDDIAEQFEILLNNLKKVETNRENEKKNVAELSTKVKMSFFEVRTKIMNALGSMEQKYLAEAEVEKVEETSKIDDFLSTIANNRLRIERLKDQFLQLKEYGNDMQVFMRSREIKKEILAENASLEATIKDGCFSNIKPKVFSGMLFPQNIFKSWMLTFRREPENIDLEPLAKESGVAQVQLGFDGKVGAKLRKEIDISPLQNTCNCNVSSIIHLEKDTLLFTSRNENKVIKLQSGGSQEVIYEGSPFSMTVLSPYKFAVSFPDLCHIKLISAIKMTEMHQIRLGKGCQPWGISHSRGLLLIAFRYCGLQIRDLQGQIIKQILPYTSEVCDIYVHLTGNFLYSSNFEAGHICCWDLNGNKLWTFRDEQLLGARNMCTDIDGNLFVACTDTNNIVFLSKDGKTCKTVIRVEQPKSVCFDMSKSLLYVCSLTGKWLNSYEITY